ncbi:MAG: GAP family protein [Actinomycetes bacterium]
MSHLLFQILPLACGAAISPTLLIIAVLSLSSPVHPLKSGWAVAAGSFLALIFYSVLGLLIGSAIHHQSHRNVDITIAFSASVLLAFLGIRQLVKLSQPATGKTLADRLNRTSAKAYFTAGVVVMLSNITSLVLFFPALHEISKSDAGLFSCGIALFILLLFLMLPVIIPVGFVTILGSKAKPGLAKLHTYITKYTVQITVVVEFLFSIYFLVKGFVELTS